MGSPVTLIFHFALFFRPEGEVPAHRNEGEDVEIVISRTSEIKISDPNTGLTLSNNNIPYGSFLYVKNKKKIKKGTLVCEWDPYNGVIISH